MCLNNTEDLMHSLHITTQRAITQCKYEYTAQLSCLGVSILWFEFLNGALIAVNTYLMGQIGPNGMQFVVSLKQI